MTGGIAALHGGVFDLFTLAFDSSPIKGEGDMVGCMDRVM